MADPILDLCDSLQHRLSADAIVRRHSPSYAEILKSYFSLQEATIRPACFVQPSTANDVAQIIKEINGVRSKSINSVQFAVKSGGHTAWAGSANIEHGVTIDLAKLNQVDVAADHATTKIGPGARWSDVYSKLDPMGLAVVGARAAQVGVGGLLLGGGLSFFSPQRGFACDNVVDFEIVLANGRIVHANGKNNRDLWVALKGGSNNFGIVTQFTVKTFEQGQLWGGINFSPIDQIDSQLDAFHKFTADPEYDENAVLIQSITFNSTRGSQGIANCMHSTAPVEEPPVLKPFWNAPSRYKTLRTTSLLDLTTELGASSPNGRGELYMTITFKSDPQLLKKAYSLYNETIPGLASIQNLFWALIFQPLPPSITSKTRTHGTNSLGLGGAPPLALALISSAWDFGRDTDRVVTTARKLIADIDSAARDMGLHDDYIYLNYAYEGQDVISGYGSSNKAFLQKVSRDYDPHGLFQSGCPGGFKVFP